MKKIKSRIRQNYDIATCDCASWGI